MPYKDIIVEVTGQIGIIKFNRPKSLNSFGGTLLIETVAAVRELNDHPDTVFTVLTGEGRFFSAGADVKNVGSLSEGKRWNNDAEKKVEFMKGFIPSMHFPYLPPIVQQTIQSCVLSATSNILAQCITSYRDDIPLSIDSTPIIKFIILTAISTPPNVLWQQFLEEKFPAKQPSNNKKITGEKSTDQALKQAEQKSGLNIGNTAAKFALDQTVGAFVNTVLFIAGMKALDGQGLGVMLEACKNDMPRLWVAGLKLWPMVSIISFTVIPADKRILFGSCVGLLWGIYLSLLAAGH